MLSNRELAQDPFYEEPSKSQTVDELAAASKRFYSSEDERRRLMQEALPEMGPFSVVMKEHIDKLWAKGVRFAVFDMLPYINPPTIYVGMFICCGRERLKKFILTEELFTETSALIKGLTKYKEVKWVH